MFYGGFNTKWKAAKSVAGKAIALSTLGVIITAILGIEIFSGLSNKLLLSAFEDFMTIKIFKLSVIPTRPSIMAIDLAIVFVVTIVSSIIPLLYLKALKPLNILKGKKK